MKKNLTNDGVEMTGYLAIANEEPQPEYTLTTATSIEEVLVNTYGEGIESPCNPKAVWLYKNKPCYELEGIKIIKDENWIFVDNGEDTDFNKAVRILRG